MEENKVEDLVIIGAGPAGLSASVYASRYGIKHVVISMVSGGLITESHKVENYLGMESLSGVALSQKMAEHAQRYSPEMITGKINTIKKIEKNNFFEIQIQDKQAIFSRAIILAAGTKPRHLNIPGEKELIGQGVSYCATCDGFFYKNKRVAVIGGGNSAVGAAMHLSEWAEKTFLIYRKAELPAEEYWKRMLLENKKIIVIYNTNVVEVLGQERVKKIKLDTDFGDTKEILVDGLFIEAGADPNWEFAESLELESDEGGYLKIKADGSTSREGIWAAGDITTGSNKFRQVVTAAAEGAIAAQSVFNYLKRKK